MSWVDAESLIKNTASTVPSTSAFVAASASKSKSAVSPPFVMPLASSRAVERNRVPLPSGPIASRFPFSSPRRLSGVVLR